MLGEFLHVKRGQIQSLASYFEGPWDSIERRIVHTNAPATLSQQDKEVAAYVITGTGELEVNGRGFRLESGSAALLLKDSAVIFRADQRLELLLVSLFTPKD
jgi:hypothetical protein